MAQHNEVKLHFLDYWRVIRIRWVLILLSFLLVLLTAAVVTYFQPRQYQSSVFIEVRSTAQNPHIWGPGGDSSMPIHDPQLAPTVFQVIKRTSILYPVIDDLKLQAKWSEKGETLSREQCFLLLRNRIQVEEIRNTDLLQVSVFDKDAHLAAAIANKIVGVYQDTRVEEEKDIMNRAITSMNDEIVKQQKRVDEASAEVGRIRDEEHIVDLNLEGKEDAETPLNTLVVKQEGLVNDAESQVAAMKTQLEELEGIKGEDLMRMLATMKIEDPTITKTLPAYQDTVAIEAQLMNSGLGENHPKVKALRATKQVYQKQLEDQVKMIRSALQKNLTTARTTRDEFQKRLELINQRQLASRNLSANYTRAKNKYIKERELLDAIRMRAQTQTMELAMPRVAISIKEPAEAPLFPARPRVALNLILGSLVGLMVGLGLAFFIEYLDTSVKTMEDVEKILGVPVLAIIPKNIRLLHKEPGDTPDAEAYRILRTNLEFNRKNSAANCIALVSGGRGEGKSTTLANLAFISAQGGYSTLIIDGDLRRPVQHELFDVKNETGLTNYLTTEMAINEVIVPTEIENLSMIPSGTLPADPVAILNSQRMSDLIAELKLRYDLVLIDSPPVLGVSDASVIASEADYTVIVVQHRRFPCGMLLRLKQAVLGVGGKVLGVVLNNVDLRHDQNYYYYTGYYGYYAPRPEGSRGDRSRSGAAATASNGASNVEEDY
jgi:capsular exopolysaccharide synthesis family protein